MNRFVPTNPAEEDRVVANDGWYPDLSVAACRSQTGLPAVHGTDRIAAELQSAAIELNAGIIAWRATQTAASLAAVTATTYGDTSEKVALYVRAVYCLVRARLTDVTRDYDSSAKGHDRADALADTVAVWRQMSQEALSRLTDRARTTVELI